VLCIHASRPRAGGALYEQSISERTGRSGPVARQRSALEDFLQARAGCCIDTDSQGKVLKRVKKIERGSGGIHDQDSNAKPRFSRTPWVREVARSEISICNG
jgi:hypothetical protein